MENLFVGLLIQWNACFYTESKYGNKQGRIHVWSESVPAPPFDR